MSALIRADAGFDFGLGHLHRCLSLATALRDVGVRCSFLSSGKPAVQGRIEAAGFAGHALDGVAFGGRDDWQRTLDAAARERCQAIVVDSYRIDAEYLEGLRAAGFFVVVIDDFARFPFPCQLVVGSAEPLRYRSVHGDTRFLLGPRFALLRPEFAGVPARPVPEHLRNVLITLGGADGSNLTPLVLETLDAVAGDFTVTVVVGPFFRDPRGLAAAARGCRRRVSLVERPDRLIDLILQADFAISAAGQTLYELAATGTPAVAIRGTTRTYNVDLLSRAGAIRSVVVEGRDDLPSVLGGHLKDVLTAARRAEMSEAGRRMIDGHGASRVSRVLSDRLTAGTSCWV